MTLFAISSGLPERTWLVTIPVFASRSYDRAWEWANFVRTSWLHCFQHDLWGCRSGRPWTCHELARSFLPWCLHGACRASASIRTVQNIIRPTWRPTWLTSSQITTRAAGTAHRRKIQQRSCSSMYVYAPSLFTVCMHFPKRQFWLSVW